MRDIPGGRLSLQIMLVNDVVSLWYIVAALRCVTVAIWVLASVVQLYTFDTA